MKAEGCKGRRNSRRAGLLTLLMILPLTAETAPAFAGDNPLNITVNWEAAAVYCNALCFEPETFHVSGEDFCARKMAIEWDLFLGKSVLQ